MTDDRRKRLIAYCPGILDIEADFPNPRARAALIMFALIARIIEKGEFPEFARYARKQFWSGHKGSDFYDGEISFFQWLLSSPAHFAEVAGEAIEAGVLKID